MRRVDSVVAVAGQGLRGDRYFYADDVPAEERDPGVEVTLIEQEGIDAARRDSGIDIHPEDTRRNLVTNGMRLDALIGKKFWIGEVHLEGVRPNPPCAHLVSVSNKDLLKPLVHRGGIRARILTTGTMREGDPVRADAGGRGVVRT